MSPASEFLPTDERHQEDRCRSWRRTEDIDDALFIPERILVACRKELERGTADLQIQRHERFSVKSNGAKSAANVYVGVKGSGCAQVPDLPALSDCHDKAAAVCR
jgi:hypothetical protein